jgi:hypothetical protein
MPCYSVTAYIVIAMAGNIAEVDKNYGYIINLLLVY